MLNPGELAVILRTMYMTQMIRNDFFDIIGNGSYLISQQQASKNTNKNSKLDLPKNPKEKVGLII